MTVWERRCLQGANLLVAGTGIVYAVMRYGMEPIDEFSVINHPWQPHVMHLHVLVAPLLVFACGLIWQRHIAANLRRGRARGRRSGPGLLFALVPMVLSGYLIQTTVADAWRAVWVAVHLATSGAWTLMFAAHLLRTYRVRRHAAPE